MALKNTYLKLPAATYIKMAQDALVKAGVSGVQFGYTDGFCTSLAFSILLKGQEINFRLPVNWKNFQKVLIEEGISRAVDDPFAYRVAWACTKDWIEAQMAFVESENVTIPQVFLPYAVTKSGETVFEKVANNPGFLLGGGKEDTPQ